VLTIHRLLQLFTTWLFLGVCQADTPDSCSISTRAALTGGAETSAAGMRHTTRDPSVRRKREGRACQATISLATL
jgi:hypothetical protein